MDMYLRYGHKPEPASPGRFVGQISIKLYVLQFRVGEQLHLVLGQAYSDFL